MFIFVLGLGIVIFFSLIVFFRIYFDFFVIKKFERIFLFYDNLIVKRINEKKNLLVIKYLMLEKVSNLWIYIYKWLFIYLKVFFLDC